MLLKMHFQMHRAEKPIQGGLASFEVVTLQPRPVASTYGTEIIYLNSENPNLVFIEFWIFFIELFFTFPSLIYYC